MKSSYKELVLKKIKTFKSGHIFITNDFLEISSYERIRNILNRLVNDNIIHRVLNGIYYKPKYNNLINDYETEDINQVALAIARKYNWTIIPSGNTALNLLGLSTQVPAKWTYLSDGRYITYSFNNTNIEFKKRNNAEISKMSTTSALVIQAIKTIGKDRINKKQINTLKKRLTNYEKRNLLKEGKTATSWVYEVLRKIGEK